jgi:hypothetical protein
VYLLLPDRDGTTERFTADFLYEKVDYASKRMHSEKVPGFL